MLLHVLLTIAFPVAVLALALPPVMGPRASPVRWSTAIQLIAVVVLTCAICAFLDASARCVNAVDDQACVARAFWATP